jgi:hypothetical protein
VDLDDIDISFFVVTVDLWSEDAKQEMNLVLHPSSGDRYPPLPQPPKPPRRRTNTASVPAIPATPLMGASLHRSNSSPSPALQNISRQDSGGEGVGGVPLIASYHTSPPYPVQNQDHNGDTPSYAPTYESAETPSHPTWGYGADASSNSNLPPSSDASDLWTANGANTKADDAGTLSFRPWSSDIGTYPPLDFGSSAQSTDSLWSHPPSSMGSGGAAITSNHGEGNRFPSSSPSDTYGSSHQHQTPAYDPALYTSSYHGPSHFYPPSTYPNQHQQVSISQQGAGKPSGAGSPSNSNSQLPIISPPTLPRIFSPPRHTYTRTLVGPLSASACRLLDEHRKPGIFFLFQDLSVRTEGTFRLRMRLMNIGSPSIPDAGATRVHNDISPVLAQVCRNPIFERL